MKSRDSALSKDRIWPCLRLLLSLYSKIATKYLPFQISKGAGSLDWVGQQFMDSEIKLFIIGRWEKRPRKLRLGGNRRRSIRFMGRDCLDCLSGRDWDPDRNQLSITIRSLLSSSTILKALLRSSKTFLEV